MTATRIKMRLGIMQPYFAPALGYFDLISLCDKWVVFDVADYRPKSWMVRNRILHPTSGWQYIKAQTGKVSRGTPIRDVRLVAGREWRDLIIRQLEHYRKRAPFFEDTCLLVERSLASDTDSLAQLSVQILSEFCSHLKIDFSPLFFSEMDLPIGPIGGPGDWALRISEAMGASEYVNPPGGRDLFDAQAFADAGIKLSIREFEDLSYETRGYEHIPMLSIIDVMMWNSPTRIVEHLSRERSKFESIDP
jgi:hypothetical protein